MMQQQLYFSDVLNQSVINKTGQRLGRFSDLVITPGEEYATVTHLLFRRAGDTVAVPWDRVLLFNPAVISISGSVNTLHEHRGTAGEIHVKRDILDKQIVDVNGAKVVRVNDLKLEHHRSALCLISVDVGFRGLLRRLGYEKLWGLVQKNIPEREIGWGYVGHLEPNAAKLTLTMAREQMGDMHPADLAHIISRVSRQNIQTVLDSLDDETAGEAIHELEPELRSRVINELDSERASDILEEMSPDEAADVLGDLTAEKAEELLGLMDADDAEEIQELLEHEEDVAGGMMDNSFISIVPGLTVAEALEALKAQAGEVDSVYYAYVLDEEERLLGVVTLKELLLEEGALPVAEVMTENLKTVPVDAEPEEILEIIAKYNLVAVPVLEDDGRMVGIVTVDDIIERFLPLALRHKLHPTY